MNSTAASSTHRFIGTTDDSTTCENCGREELRSTVILGILDADGNVTETVYYGSTCAARALTVRTGRKHTGAKVLAEARSAQMRREAADRDARQMLNHYGLPLTGKASAEALAAAAAKYAETHRTARWADSADWFQMVSDMLTRRQAQVL